MRVWIWLLAMVAWGTAQPPAVSGVAGGFGRPAVISVAELSEFAGMAEDRRQLVEVALAVARDSPWLRYTVGGGTPEEGGFDCSGAMHFVMKKRGLDPPRSSAGQLQWLKDRGRFHEVPAEAKDADHPSLAGLLPGDLLFWGKRDGGSFRIHHVAMYLGREKKDGLRVMINSTDGRSYRGVKANGYGVFDFRLPVAGSASVFVGYGTPPGIAVGAADGS